MEEKIDSLAWSKEALVALEAQNLWLLYEWEALSAWVRLGRPIIGSPFVPPLPDHPEK